MLARCRGSSRSHSSYQDDRDEHEVELRITKSLKNLLRTELAVLDTSLVDTDVLEQGNLLTRRQPPSLHGCVREEQEGAETNEHSDATQSHKHDTPASKRGTGTNVLEAKRHSTSDNLAQAQTEIPEGKPRSLLRLGVPLAADEHQGRTDGGLEDTQEDSRHEERGVVVSGSTTGGSDAP